MTKITKIFSFQIILFAVAVDKKKEYVVLYGKKNSEVLNTNCII